MTVTSIEKDFDSLTLILTADFDASVDRVWQLWADPRKMERWWGPPTYPSTFERFELAPGGSVAYYMTGPGGEKYHGWWQVTAVNPPTSLEFTDGFADQDGNPVADMPVTRVTMQLSERAGGTRMEVRSIYDSREDMQKVMDMGMEEGIRQSAGQMDALLVA